MLDIKFIRENPDQVKDSISKRAGNPVLVDDLLVLDEKRKAILQKKEELQQVRNAVSKEIPSIKDNEEKQKKVAEMKGVREQIDTLDEEQKGIDEQYFDVLYQIPNLLSSTTAIGPDEDHNVVEETFKEKTEFDFDIKTHYELGEEKGWMDIKKGSEVSGARFWYLKGDLVTLQFAIVNYALAALSAKGFTQMLPPFLVREQAMYGTGFFPAEKNEIYNVNADGDDLYLIGTSEVPLTSYHAKDVLEVDQPIKYVGYSTCFRREAGTYGKDTAGILRGHQFDKVEMVCFCKPEESEQLHNEMIAIEEEIWQALGIPYQKVNVCSGDLGNPAMKKYDLEAWMPGQQKYREVTSCSNIGAYQSTRLGIKYRNKDGKLEPVHTLNGTVVALSRCLIAIIENYQNQDGTVTIPEVLRPFMGGRETI